MQHGYFDDFRAVRDQEGKIFASPERLLDAQVSEPFPQTEVNDYSTCPQQAMASHVMYIMSCTDGPAKWQCSGAASKSQPLQSSIALYSIPSWSRGVHTHEMSLCMLH